jgi:nicotinamide-nucleotide amidase
MNATIITIGDELLIGQTIDTNSAWMAQELNKIGITIYERIAIADDKAAICNTVNKGINQSDLILITGGLGPTNDDITKATLCDLFNGKLVINSEVEEWVKVLFIKRNLPYLERNRSQSLVPDNCKVLFNSLGTAPGLLWQLPNNKIVVAMPGVPFEMQYLMETHVLPLVANASPNTIIHQSIITTGIGESFLAEKLIEFEAKLPLYIKLAYLPSLGFVKLRLTATHSNKELINKEISDLTNELNTIINQWFFYEGDAPFETIIFNLFTQNNITLAVAESCTGGFLAGQLILVPGASKYFIGGVVSYAQALKINMLHVNASTIAAYGEVSEEVAKEMCAGVLKTCKSDYALAISGIAGPSGGSDLKPVGTVCVAVGSSKHIHSHTFHFKHNRKRNIELTFNNALAMLKKTVEMDFSHKKSD